LPKKGDIEWTDIIQGKVSLPINKQEIDPIILSASGKPSRSFAAAVDDWELKVSHALRDEGDMRRVTAQQRLLCKMLELDAPEFAHIPSIANDKGAKLLKEPTLR